MAWSGHGGPPLAAATLLRQSADTGHRLVRGQKGQLPAGRRGGIHDHGRILGGGIQKELPVRVLDTATSRTGNGLG